MQAPASVMVHFVRQHFRPDLHVGLRERAVGRIFSTNGIFSSRNVHFIRSL